MNRMNAAKQAVSQGLNSMKEKLAKLKAPRNDGKALEEQVGRILSKEGYRSVELNTRVKDPNGNWSEIDVIGKDRSFFYRFFHFSRHIPYGNKAIYVECKQYAADNRVSLGDVSKFKEVLQLNRVPINQGLFVTTSAYVPRATTIGINTVDGNQLRKWIRKHRSISQTQQRLTHAANIGVAFVLMVLYGSLILDVRESRTKTLKFINDVNDKGLFEDSVNQHGQKGFLVTAGLSPEERFSTILYTFELFKYAFRYLYTKATDGDIKSVHMPTKNGQTKSTSYNAIPTSKPPNTNSFYIAYELHRPLPTQEPQREKSISYLQNHNQKMIDLHPLLSKIPKALTDYYSYYAFSHDYILLNCNYETFPMKFIPSNLSQEFFEISDPNSSKTPNTSSSAGDHAPTTQTLFKLPVPHALSVPGYFLSYSAMRVANVRQLLHQIIPPISDSIMDPASDKIDSFISSTGSLVGNKSSSSGFGLFSERSSNQAFGDNFFNNTSPSSSNENKNFTFNDPDSPGDDFGSASSQEYLSVAFARHEDE